MENLYFQKKNQTWFELMGFYRYYQAMMGFDKKNCNSSHFIVVYVHVHVCRLVESLWSLLSMYTLTLLLNKNL